MNYKNPISRYLLRRNLFSRVKMRLSNEARKLTKNEFDDLKYLYSLLGEEPGYIFDCGSNIGLVSYEFSKRFPTAEIHAFEPNPVIFKEMDSLLSSVAGIRTRNLGIAAEPGILEFRQNSNSGTSSFRDPDVFHPHSRVITKVQTPVTSIDEYCSEAGIEKIHILKLDIEGFELEALRGAGRFMEGNRIDFIFSEVNLVPTYKSQPCIEDIVAYCRTKDFYPYNFYGINESSTREGILTNILFISNAVAERLNGRLGANTVFTTTAAVV